MMNLYIVSINLHLNAHAWLVATTLDNVVPESCFLYETVFCSVSCIRFSRVHLSCLVCLAVFLCPCGRGSGMQGVWNSLLGGSQPERLHLSTGKAGTTHVGACRPR